MRLEKRLRALEARLVSNPVLLDFADGTTREIHGRADYLLDLFAGACGHQNLSSKQSTDLELIRQCLSAREPGGGHMVEVIQCLLQGRGDPAYDGSE